MKQTHKTAQTRATPANTRPRSSKKTRAPRVTLTHVEVRRGEALRLRVSVADDALSEIGNELGALIKRITPGAAHPQPDDAPLLTSDFLFTRTHSEDDEAYHADLHDHLVDLFTALCDAGLEDAITSARNEQARRLEGAN